MKKMAILFSIVIFIFFSIMILEKNVFCAKDPQTSSTVGRFQLFQGTYTVLDAKNNKAQKENDIFLLDTLTGEVKKYTTGLNEDGTFFEFWGSAGQH